MDIRESTSLIDIRAAQYEDDLQCATIVINIAMASCIHEQKDN